MHTITPAGRKALHDFANEPIRAAVTRDEVLLRIFFGNFADEPVVMREIEAYLDRIRLERAFMEATETRIKAHPGPRHEARRFQLLSLRLKVAQYRAMEQELARFCGIKRKRRSAKDAKRGSADNAAPLALVYPIDSLPRQRSAKGAD